jgi:N-acetylmuramoyl-L-alanine amidase
MIVVDDRLAMDGAEHSYRASPNFSGELHRPLGIVMHFTAGRGFEQSCDWLCNPKSKASAHVVIGREGQVQQLVAFDRIAWHAGESKWTFEQHRTTVERLNAYTLGIELDNFGHLQRRANGWHTYFGKPVPASDVVIALDETGWHAYTEEQLERAMEVCETLVAAYPSITELLGHSDIAPRRKQDPGPAFPMLSFRSRLFGRQQGEA